MPRTGHTRGQRRRKGECAFLVCEGNCGLAEDDASRVAVDTVASDDEDPVDRSKIVDEARVCPGSQIAPSDNGYKYRACGSVEERYPNVPEGMAMLDAIKGDFLVGGLKLARQSVH